MKNFKYLSLEQRQQWQTLQKKIDDFNSFTTEVVKTQAVQNAVDGSPLRIKDLNAEIQNRGKLLEQKIESFFEGITNDESELALITKHSLRDSMSSLGINQQWYDNEKTVLLRDKEQSIKDYENKIQILVKENENHSKQARIHSAKLPYEPIPKLMNEDTFHFIIMTAICIGEMPANVSAVSYMGEFPFIVDCILGAVVSFVFGISAHFTGVSLKIKDNQMLIMSTGSAILLFIFVGYLRFVSGGHWWFILLNVGLFLIGILKSYLFQEKTDEYKAKKGFREHISKMKQKSNKISSYNKKVLNLTKRTDRKLLKIEATAKNKSKNVKPRDIPITNKDTQNTAKRINAAKVNIITQINQMVIIAPKTYERAFNTTKEK